MLLRTLLIVLLLAVTVSASITFVIGTKCLPNNLQQHYQVGDLVVLDLHQYTCSAGIRYTRENATGVWFGSTYYEFGCHQLSNEYDTWYMTFNYTSVRYKYSFATPKDQKCVILYSTAWTLLFVALMGIGIYCAFRFGCHKEKRKETVKKLPNGTMKAAFDDAVIGAPA